MNQYTNGKRLLYLFALLTSPFSATAADLETFRAERIVVPTETVLNGQIEAVKQATISSQTSGRVTDVLFDVDDYVPKGEILVRLRDTEQQARLAKVKSSIQEAQARYDKANTDRTRKQNLLKQDAVSKAVVDAAEAEFNTAKAALAAARAQLDEATEQLEHTIIRAPYSGIVVERHIETGELVQPGTLVMTGLSLDTLRVTAAVPESLIMTVRKYRKAAVIIPGAAPVMVESDKLTISPRADAATHSFEVRLSLPPLEQPLYPGMSVKVAITTGESPRLLIPQQAIVYRSEVAGVYIVDERGIHFRQIRPGRRYSESRQEILAGLSAGEAVAIDPVQAAIALKSGQAEPTHD